MLTDRQTGNSRGMGIVKFSTKQEMENAIANMNGAVFLLSAFHCRLLMDGKSLCGNFSLNDLRLLLW